MLLVYENNFLRINPADNVAVAIAPLRAGETIEADGRTITLRTDVLPDTR